MESLQDKNDNQIYLESNELNKLMETLMNQIRTHQPEDIVSYPRMLNSLKAGFLANYMRQ